MMLFMEKIEGPKDHNRQLHNPFVALRHPGFRLYIFGMSISMIGSWMQNIAQPWLAYTITGSPFLLSLVTAMQMLPMLLFSLFAGVIIDHYPKKKILLITQAASALITLTLAILVWTDRVEFWHILLLSALLGTVNTVDIPARASFVVDLVDQEDVMNAVALNSTIFNSARIVGPALAGLAMGYLGVAFCFFLNSISFTVVIFCLLFIKPKKVSVIQKRTSRISAEIMDGLKYIFQSKTLSNTLVSTAIVTTFAMNFSVLIPVFANKVLNQQETGFGFLMSFMGVGALAGALLIAMTSRAGPSRFIMNAMPIASSALLLLTAFSRQYLLTGLILALTGFSVVSFTSTTNSIMQLNADQEYRGRVMSLYNLIFNTTALVGSLLSGFIADQYGPEYGFAACGILMALLLVVVTVVRSAASGSDRRP